MCAQDDSAHLPQWVPVPFLSEISRCQIRGISQYPQVPMDLHDGMGKQRTAAIHLTLSESILSGSLWGTFMSLDYGVVSNWHAWYQEQGTWENRPS
jgi:hypothetical protein